MHSPRRLLAAALTVCLLGSGCAQVKEFFQPVPDTAPRSTATPAPQLPIVEAIVKTKAPATQTGSAPTEVHYAVPEDIAVVAALDCSTCTGKVQLTSNLRGEPLLNAQAPTSGAYLVNVRRFERSGILTVNAQGPWSLTLTSWTDLKGVADYPKSTGGRVFLLAKVKTTGKKADATTAGRLLLSYKPADKDDTIVIRTYPFPKTDTGQTLTQGAAKSSLLLLERPAVVQVITRGTWSLLPPKLDAAGNPIIP